MAKIVAFDSRRWVLNKTPRLFYYRRLKDGSYVVSKRPVPRKHTNDALQKLWRGDMKRTVNAIKNAGPCELATATALSFDSGYTWKDVLYAASHGKLTLFTGGVGATSGPAGPGAQDPQIPAVFQLALSKKWEGKPRVLTPTAQYHNDYDDTCLTDNFTSLNTPTKDWDNNNFGSQSMQPAEFTVHQSGLYLVSASVRLNNTAARELGLYLHLRDGGYVPIAAAFSSTNL